MTAPQPRYGPVESVQELGRLVRARRKRHRVTLKTLSGLSRLSMRFLSEFERGKETAEIGKVLKALHNQGLEMVIRPRPPSAPARPAPAGDGPEARP